MAGKSIVILGGGIGGVVAAHELRRRLGREHRIVLLDREPEHRFQASYPWVMMGWRKPSQVSRPLASLSKRGVEYRQTNVTAIDTERRAVETDSGPVTYDYLVVALGAELAEESVPGLASAGSTPYTLEGAIKLKVALRDFTAGRVAVTIASVPFKCPAAPYEVAMLIESALRKHGVRDSVDIQVYTPETLPMPVAGAAVGQALKGMLEQKGIGFDSGRKLSSADSERQMLAFDDGTTAGFDLLVHIPPHRSPATVRASALAGEMGWIPVDPRTLETASERVYAIGDVAAIRLANGLMLPKAGVFAHGEAEIVARRIAADIDGAASTAAFDGWGSCFIETGDRIAAYGSGSFYAEPHPEVQLYKPTRSRHAGRVAFEKTWLTAVGGQRAVSTLAFGAVNLIGRKLLDQSWLWDRV